LTLCRFVLTGAGIGDKTTGQTSTGGWIVGHRHASRERLLAAGEKIGRIAGGRASLCKTDPAILYSQQLETDPTNALTIILTGRTAHAVSCEKRLVMELSGQCGRHTRMIAAAG
jgi:hypothetical protein